MKLTCSYCTKYKAVYPPRNGCQNCWDIYFDKNPYKAHAVKYAIQQFGESTAVKVHGEKYVKHYHGWELYKATS